MKIINKFLTASIIVFLNIQLAIAQNPTYTLDVNNGNVGPNFVEFDIDMTWTNAGIVPNFEYAGGQVFFDANPAIGGTGTVTMSNAGSDLPVNMQPRNPTVFTSATPWQLRWAVNTFPGAGSGYNFPANVPIKVVRVHLQTTGAQWPLVPLNLTWRSALPNPFTKIFAYVGTTNTDISTPSTHTISIDNSPLGGCSATWTHQIKIRDAGNISDSLFYGLAPSGTNGLDSCLGEVPVPPPPPLGVFDVRFITPTNDALKKDYRKDTTGNVFWRMTFQPAQSGYPMTFTWNNLTLPASGSFFLKDEITGTLVNVNMRNQNTYTLTNTGITSLKVEYLYTRTLSSSVNTGWNIVSVPVRTQDMLYTTLFPGVASQAYTYSGGYASVSLLSNGTGYWMYFNNNANFNFTGYPWLPENMPVSPGWNLIGPFMENIPVSAILSNPPGIVNSSYFGYTGGYYNPDTLKVGKGYWIRTTSAGYLYKGMILDNLALEQDSDPKDNFVELNFSSGEGNGASLYLANATQITSDYSLPPVPPQEIFDARFGSDKFVEELGKNHTLKISSNGEPVRLTVHKTGGTMLRIKDAIDGSIFSKVITEGTEITIPANLNNLILETTGTIPLTYELSQNYPNPFNPSTTIEYQIPNDGLVKIAVYDVLGREVLRIVDSYQTSGTYEVKLDASSLATGVYYYKMHSGNFSDVKKMILMK